MSILVTERWSGPGLTYSAGGYRAGRIFDVTGASTKAAAIAAVVSYDPSTAYNAKHPQSIWMYVDNQDAPPSDKFGFWQVNITYSSNPAGRHPDPGNPLTEPIEYDFQWGYRSEGCDRDNVGRIIQNAALQSFSSLTPTDVLTGTLIATRNEPFYDAAKAVAYSNAVNSASVGFGPGRLWILSKGQACCKSIRPLSKITSASPYARIQYTIELRGGYKNDADGYWDGFKIRIENDGTSGWYDGGTGDFQEPTKGPFIEVVKDSIQNVSFPIRLKLDGTPIDAAYKVGCPTATSSNGYAAPIPPPSQLAATLFENAGDAYFYKVFPQTVKLLDLNTLALNT